jgi:archaellin
MQTGQETIGEVSTGLAVTGIAGYRADNETDLGFMTITVQPRSGSFSIDLNQTYVEISNSDEKIILRYNFNDSGVFIDTGDIAGDLFNTTHYANLTEQTFGIIVLEDPRNSVSHETPVIKKGGKVMLTVNLTAVFGAGLDTRKDIWGVIQPEEGAAGVFAFTTPASYPTSKNVYALY